MQKGFVFILILAVIIGIFAISNSAVVTIDFIVSEVEVSQAIVIFICVLLGAVIATIFGGIRQMSLSKEIKKLREENQIYREEIEELKIKIEEKEKKDDFLNLEEIDKENKIQDKDDFYKL